MKILLIEDNEDDRILIGEYLSAAQAGTFDCETADTLAGGLERLDGRPFDLALLDLSLPDSHGLATFDRVRAARVNLPIIVLSGSADEGLAAEAVQRGAQDYLVKGRINDFMLPRAIRYAIERTRTERAIRESEAKYRELVDNAMVGIYRTDLDGNIHFANQALATTLGFDSVEELQATSIKDRYARVAVREEIINHLREHGKLNGWEVDMVTRTGQTRHLLLSANLSGDIICGMLLDATARKEAERTSERLVNSSLDMIIAVDKDRVVTQFNPAAQATFGYTEAEILGQSVDCLYADPMEGNQVHEVTLRDGRCVREVKNRRKNGELFPSLLAASILRDSDNHVTGVMGVSRDVTEQRQAEHRLREQAELLDHAPDAISVKNMNGEIVYWNPGAERLYGWTAAQVLGRRGDEVLPFLTAPEALEARRITLEKGEWAGELKQQNRAGRPLVVRSRRIILRDTHGTPKSELIINTDITEQKNLESQLFRVQRLDSIGTLAGGVAHDLNNILAPILMASEMLSMSHPDPEDQKWLGTITTAAQRGAKLVRQILSFARGSEGERGVIQLTHLISELVKVCQQTFPRSIQITAQLPKNLNPVACDASQIDQVVMNLCVNARDAMHEGGRLRIEANNFHVDEAFTRMHLEAAVGPYVVISVSDTGMGIKPEVIDRIFDPFFTTKTAGQGTGLGLSTVIGIVKSHGGFITAASKLNEGSTFKVYLPAASVMSEPEPTKSRSYPLGKDELVLVVDDEAAIREVTRSLLERARYRVLTAVDGADAIATFARNSGEVRLVITDLAMPVMDGHATMRAIRRLDEHVPIICVSGVMENQDETENGSLPQIHFLGKPYTADILLRLVREVLDSAPPVPPGQGVKTG